jgi:hypothetical protein
LALLSLSHPSITHPFSQVGASGQERAFVFDVVLGPESSQHAMFQECGMTRLIDMAVQG